MDRHRPAWLLGICLTIMACVPVPMSADRVRRQESEGSLPTSAPTSFSCDVHGPGYFADMEADCQVFHVCHAQYMDSFSCPGGTRFNQKTFVCDWGSNVDCPASPRFYALNNRIGSLEPFRRSSDTAGGPQTDTSLSVSVSFTRVSEKDADTSINLLPAEAAADPFGSFSQNSVTTARLNNAGTRQEQARQHSDGGLAALDQAQQAAADYTILPNRLSVEEPSFVGVNVADTTPSTVPPSSAAPSPSPPSPPPFRASPPVSASVPTSRLGSTTARPLVVKQQEDICEQTKNQQVSASVSTANASGSDGAERPGYLPEPNSYLTKPSGYLPEPNSYLPKPNTYLPKPNSYLPEQSGYLPEPNENRPEPVSNSFSTGRERDGYLPLGETKPVTSQGRTLAAESNGYLPVEGGPPTTEESSSGRNYLPQPGLTPPASSLQESDNNLRSDTQFGSGGSLGAFPLPSLSFSIPSVLSESPTRDEYATGTETTLPPLSSPPPSLPPPSNDLGPPGAGASLASATPSYGVLTLEKPQEAVLPGDGETELPLGRSVASGQAAARPRSRTTQIAGDGALKSGQTPPQQSIRRPAAKKPVQSSPQATARPAQQTTRRRPQQNRRPTAARTTNRPTQQVATPRVGQQSFVSSTDRPDTDPAYTVKPSAPLASQHSAPLPEPSATVLDFGRRLPNSNRNTAVSVTPKPIKFQYDFNKVISRLQERLRDAGGPLAVPAAESRRRVEHPAADPTRGDRGGAPLPAYMYPLSQLPL